ncbi:hypothetical protein RHGRI_012068 [Rhododendron griersonianum]|uniref:Fe2OG dioxygenase domain-containing protein n=1 Tax=Rhododendron griersonianum TaxID=479676 RepID=A0AAV6KQ83_9ERIC|nr:hypothetical protein RHGRI_012068 [Rhododendron griersonianum]
MVVTSKGEEVQEHIKPEYDRKSELKAFDDTKTGVKGLVDAGVTKIPRIFIHDKSQLIDSVASLFSVPIIDLEGVDKGSAQRAGIIEKVRDACEKFGFFQVVNHGIAKYVMDEMIDGIRRFHEQDIEVKKGFYTRDFTRRIVYKSNFDLDILIEYSKQVMRLGLVLFEILSEALGLNPNHLKDMDCAEGLLVLGHYYPACPEPDLTLGTSNHADNGFFTILLQDQMGGLQILHENQWVDVPPVPGALVVNIADLLQASPYNCVMYLQDSVIQRRGQIHQFLYVFFYAAHHERQVQKRQNIEC